MFDAKNGGQDELSLLQARINDLANECGLNLDCGRSFFNVMDGRFEELDTEATAFDLSMLQAMLRMYLRLQSASCESTGPGRIEQLWTTCRSVLSRLQRFQLEDRQAIMLAWQHI